MNSRQSQLTTTLLQFYERPIAKVSLELVLSIIAVIFFALFAIRPTLVTMSDLIKEIQDKEELSQKLSQKIAALSTVQNEYLIAQEQLAILDQAIPPTPRFEEALKIIEKIASDQRIVIVSMEAKEVPKEPVNDIAFKQKVRVSRPVSVTLTGDYPSMRQFIEQIRNTQRAMSVDSIIFSLNDQRGKKVLTANVTISIHYFDQRRETEASPTPNPLGTSP